MADVKFTSPNLNQFISDPQLGDLFNILERQILLNFNCHHIGTIQSFDPDQQTANILINYKRTYWTRIPDNDKGVYSPKNIDYPPLIDCPVFVLGGGNQYLSFPIRPGDECMVLFNDRDMDNWFSYTQSGAPLATGRLHSFSDGVALVGLRSFHNSINSYDTSRAVLGNAERAYVGVSDTKVKIANQTKNLETILQTLITKIESLVTQTALLTVTCAAPGNPSSIPINAATITAINTDLAAVAADLGALLE